MSLLRYVKYSRDAVVGETGKTSVLSDFGGIEQSGGSDMVVLPKEVHESAIFGHCARPSI